MSFQKVFNLRVVINWACDFVTVVPEVVRVVRLVASEWVLAYHVERGSGINRLVPYFPYW